VVVDLEEVVGSSLDCRNFYWMKAGRIESVVHPVVVKVVGSETLSGYVLGCYQRQRQKLAREICESFDVNRIR
jgi:hypothetical protein